MHPECREAMHRTSREEGGWIDWEQGENHRGKSWGEASSMIGRREDRIQRALQVLQKAQRYNCGTKAFRPEIMVPYADGSWLRFNDVVKAIEILQEGQQ
jgi:hypothetical protein